MPSCSFAREIRPRSPLAPASARTLFVFIAVVAGRAGATIVAHRRDVRMDRGRYASSAP